MQIVFGMKYRLIHYLFNRLCAAKAGGTIMWLCFAAAIAHAEVGLTNAHPNLSRGSSDDKTMERYDFDSVNLFNGNLSISIPVGIKYALTRSFGYRFSINYNSNVWDLDNPGSTIVAAPIRHSNAGFGWDVSFGRLIPPAVNRMQVGRWVYVSPDGAYHPFYSTLHEDVSEVDPNDTALYTRDGSYIRMSVYSSTLRFVETPDGRHSLFELVNGEWKLKQIGDRFVNRLWFSYGANLLTLTDNHGRVHRIFFKADTTGSYPALVDRIELAAFNGTTSTYTFTYGTNTVALPSIDTDPATSASVSLPLLASITLPDGSKYNFNYHGQTSQDASGRIALMQLPTLGRINWTYTTYDFTGGGRPTNLGPLYKSNVGVGTRSLLDASRIEIGRWTYQPALNPAGQVECEMTNTVVTPLGDKYVYYFNVNTTSTTGVWRMGCYGLAGSPNYTDSSGSRILSLEIFDCNSTGNSCQLSRSFYVRYDQDSELNPSSPEVANTNRREASRRTLFHDDVENGVARFADLDRSEFDGLGHHRRTVTNGSFGSGDVRETYINYNAATGSYPSTSFAMPSTGAWVPNIFSQIKTTEGGASNITDFCHDAYTGVLLRSRKRHTTSPTGEVSSKDVVTVYTYDSLGQLTTEQYYGGDSQAVSTGDLCALALPATDQYQIRHTYQYGVRSSSQFYTTDGQTFGPKVVDQILDKNTGLVNTSRDSAGIATSYEYDAFGRAIWVKPQSGHGAWTNYVYATATGSEWDGAKKLTNTVQNGGGASLKYEALVYDSLGNPRIEQTRMPDGSFPYRVKNYNAMGWLTSKSEISVNAPQYTSYLDYDPFGRARIVRPPDGSHHDMTYQYKGSREVKQTVSRAISYSTSTGAINEAPRSTTKVYDRQGRLWKDITHTVNQFGDPRDVVTMNVYDVGGRLVQSHYDGNLVGTSYTYDGRGSLAVEFEPDTGSGAESIFYETIDARGNPLRTRRFNHWSNNTYWLLYDHDRAERLTAVRDGLQPSKVWKEFIYADSNGTNDWRAGKLWKTKRLNDQSRHLQMTATVSETYLYGGPGGTITQHETEFSDSIGRNEKFVQTYSYTELGEIKDVVYPKSVGGYITIGRDRTVSYNFSDGFLTSVSGAYNGQAESWMNSVTYHSNGLASQIVHSNGVTDNVSSDPNGYVRAASVTTTGAKNKYTHEPDNLNIGQFQYDGAGSLVKAGNQYFVRPDVYVPTPPSNPQGGPSVCADGWEDPLGMMYASNDSQCNTRVFYYYTAEDQLFRVENGFPNRQLKTFYFYDLKGKSLTEFSVRHFHYSPWLNDWETTRDYIYGNLGLFATHETFRDRPARIRHFHGAHGAQGMATDQNGRRQQ